ncbi:MAG: MFS transporter [Alphaproteobacteria bacterium]|nr:MFS transporter [Alphaproteobacteria bacterium]
MSETSGFAGDRAFMRNVYLLSAAQAIIGSQQALIMAAGALIGASFAPDPRLATLPTTAALVGLALAAGPAVALVHRLGRRPAFMIGASVSVFTGLVATLGILLGNFLVFSLALFFGGAAAAIGQQYRFAAADAVPVEQKGRAISYVLAGGVVAGFSGPALSYFGRTAIPGADYAGSFLAMSGVALLGVFVLAQTRLPGATSRAHRKGGRSLVAIARAPDVFVPIVAGMASYGLMTFLMVAAPLAMVLLCGHTNDDATFAIQWHIVAMFAPSFVTGTIIARIGARMTTGIGLTLTLGCALVALNGVSTWHFDLALILLGVGWNFGFIGATALLAQGYRPEDAAKAQALNEQLVFGVMALASIGSGIMLQTIGWQALNVLAIPVATGALALLAWGDWRDRDA